MSSQNIPTLLTVRRFAAKHEAFSEASLRWLIFKAGCPETDADHEHDAALNDALIRIGRRVLINEQKFFDWLTRK